MHKSPNKTTKSATVTKLLWRERGATIPEIVKSTGWKEHSVRAYLTGVRKSVTLTKEQRPDGEAAYRISEGQTAAGAKGEVAAP
jgi:hypothetical protein